MNRRELLKMLGLAATVPIIPLPFITKDGLLDTVSTAAKKITGVIVDMYAEGLSSKSALGHVALMRDDEMLLKFIMNTFGSCIKWIPRPGEEIVYDGNRIQLKASKDINAYIIVRTDAGNMVMTTATLYEEA